ncbi:MAG: ribbon-helix-helix domain-containing protein [Bacteroidales bacterium]|nr:ribbon-helix-helix domain-containing protein [Bacteroidales bacterium]
MEVKKVSPKTGRPKAENPKNINVKVRFDKALYEKLDLYCQENKITKTEAIRKGIDLLLSNKNRNVPTDQS